MSISLIRDRVHVEILRDTAAVSRVSFGVPLFIGTTDKSVRAASYANIEEVANVYDVSDPEYIAAQAFFGQQPQPRKLIIGWKDDTASPETYSEAIEAIRVVNDEWFAVAIEETDPSTATAIADTVAALPGTRQVWFRSADADILDNQQSSDIASLLKTANYDQARVVYHTAAVTTYPDMAMMGRVLPIPESRTSGPGTAAWHDQPVQGVAGDNFTSTQRATLEDKNAEFFINVAGNTRAMGGKMAGGEWGDVMHGIAWLGTRLSEDIYELLTRAADRRQKIPYTDEGIARVEGVVRNRLGIGVDMNLLASGFTTSVPRREQTQFSDRANRVLRDVTFDAPLAGAIKFVNVSGVVTA